MRNVVFVSPFYGATTPRFVAALARQPDTRLSLVRMGGLEALGPQVRGQIFADYRVDNCFDVDQLCQAVTWLGKQMGGVDALLATYEQMQEPVAMAREKLGIEGMGSEAARNFRDKARMKQVLREAGLPVARHARVTSPAEGLAFAQQVGFPLVFKPLAGAGSVATLRVNNANELQSVLDQARPSAANPWQCEEFVTGIERSFETISINGEPVFSSLTRYDPPPLTVLENPWIQWTVLLPREVEHPAYNETRRVGFGALKALGMRTGISHMEWFRRPDGAVVIGEIAARPPGAQILNLMSYAHDCRFLDRWAELMVHGRFSMPPRKYAAGAVFFRGQGPGAGGAGGRVVAVHGLKEAQEKVGHLVVEASLPRVGMFSRSSYEGEGVAIVRHPDTAVVEDALRTLIRSVRVVVDKA